MNTWIEIRKEGGEPECMFATEHVSHVMSDTKGGSVVVLINSERLRLPNIDLERAMKMVRGEEEVSRG